MLPLLFKILSPNILSGLDFVTETLCTLSHKNSVIKYAHLIYIYMIYLTAIGLPPVAVVQYTFTQKQYIEQHKRHKQYIEKHNSLIRKIADRDPSLRVYTLAFALQLRKKHGKPQSG